MDGVQLRVPMTHTKLVDVNPAAAMSTAESTEPAARSKSYCDAQFAGVPYGAFNPAESITHERSTNVDDGEGEKDTVTEADRVCERLLPGDSDALEDVLKDTDWEGPADSELDTELDAVIEIDAVGDTDVVAVNVDVRDGVRVRVGVRLLLGVSDALGNTVPVGDTELVNEAVTDTVRVSDTVSVAVSVVDAVVVGVPELDAAGVSDALIEAGGDTDGVGRGAESTLPPKDSRTFTKPPAHASCDTHCAGASWFVI